MPSKTPYNQNQQQSSSEKFCFLVQVDRWEFSHQNPVLLRELWYCVTAFSATLQGSPFADICGYFS